MRGYVISIMLLCSNLLFAQKQIEGFLYNTTNKPIESASIRIEGKGIGNISDRQGYFSLIIPDSLANYPLKISHINYIEQKLNINNILNKDTPIILKPKIQELNEISISSSIKKTKWEKGGGVYLGTTYKNILGAEGGVKMKIKGKALLRELKFSIKKCTYDSLALNIRIYRYNKENDELSDILFYTTKIISDINIDDSQKDGEEITIPIDNDLYVEEEDIFISIYYPLAENEGKIEIPAYLKTGYVRKYGETKLQSRKFNQGMSLQVTYFQ